MNEIASFYENRGVRDFDSLEAREAAREFIIKYSPKYLMVNREYDNRRALLFMSKLFELRLIVKDQYYEIYEIITKAGSP